MKLTNELTELLNIDHPIIQAPMGGESTTAMSIAVSNAGGLGGLGCSFMTTHEIEENVGIIVMCSATTVAEAVWLDKSGVDVIIAQGWEAGGHRGTFDVTFEDFGIGTMALVPQIVDAVSKPVVASGGIADGRGIAACLILGAQGVQLGTAFL